MPDKQIHPIGTETAPAEYKIPSAAELLLKSVHARYNGSAAAGAFVPLVRIISNGGSTTDEIPQDATIAAGASADATWFPHVGGAAAAAGLSAISVSFDVGGGAFAAGSNVLPIYDFSTNDSSLFSVPDRGDGLIYIAEDCSLLAVGRLSFSPAEDLADALVLIVLGAPAAGFSGDIANVPADAANIIHTGYLDGSTVLAVSAGDFSGLVLQLDGPVANVTGAGLALIKLTGSQLF